jgi:transcriptional regulator with XRE-family HTH domain
MDTQRQTIGDNLRRIRRDSGKTMAVLTKAAQLTPGYWYEVERGEVNVTIDALQSIASALSVTVLDLLEPAKPKRRASA